MDPPSAPRHFPTSFSAAVRTFPTASSLQAQAQALPTAALLAAQVAYPSPTLTSTCSRHPPYVQMITEAIGALKDRNGSSRQAIAKYINRVYSGLPATHSALLSHHLKRLKNSGKIVMVNHSYKLPASAPRVLANGPKRGPGRPRKPMPVANHSPPRAQQKDVNATVGPEFISVPQSVFASLGLDDGPTPSPEKRRGRESQTTTTSIKRGRGRPPKALNTGPGGVGVPRPRGRPRRNASGSAVAGGNCVVKDGIPAEKTGGRLRRSPKNQHMRPRMLSGKPLGGPRKIASSTAAQPSPLQQLLAYQELKSRLEYFQRRIKQSVNILKPCLNSQTTASAWAALQELEELAMLDFTAT